MRNVLPDLVVGTYERFLLGYTAKGLDVELVRVFTYPAHQGPVRCLAAGGPFLVSGGADDQIHLYDLQRGKDLGFLINPGQGAVPCMELFAPRGAAPTHLLSGSAGGSIAIWRAGGSWELLKVMKGHKATVNALAVHPSGRLALSVGHDLALRMWDLSKGRCSYTAKLDAEASNIMFAPSGESYSVICGATVTLHSASGEGGVLASYTAPARITAALPQAHDSALLLGLEDGQLQLLDARVGAAVLASGRAHGARIRGLSALRTAGGGLEGMLPGCFASASSDGLIRVWDSRMVRSDTGAGSPSTPWKHLCSVATRARITCLCVWPPELPVAIPTTGESKQSAGNGEAVACSQDQQAQPTGKKGKVLAQRHASVDGTGAAAMEVEGELQRGPAKLKPRQRPAGAQATVSVPEEQHQQQHEGHAWQPGQPSTRHHPQLKPPQQPRAVRKGSKAASRSHGTGVSMPVAGGPAASAGTDEALVPWVQTRVSKKVNRKQRKAERERAMEDLMLEHGVMLDG